MNRESCYSFAALFGRLCLSAIFLLSGFNKITNWSGTVEHMTQQGMSAVPLVLAGAIAFEVLGGLSLLLGLYGRLGAILLIAFMIPTTVIFHDFWAVDPAQQQMQMIHFMKNLAIVGGLFMVVAHGAGRYSVDRCLNRVATRHAEYEHRNEPMMVG